MEKQKNQSAETDRHVASADEMKNAIEKSIRKVIADFCSQNSQSNNDTDVKDSDI